MTKAVVKEHVSRETRYQIQANRPLEVVIERETDEGTETTRGLLEELSPGGAKISVSSSFPFEGDLELRIEVDELELVIAATAKIHWARPDKGSKWMLGCSVRPKISEEVLTLLATAGYIDRRQTTRTPLSVRTAVQWELQSKKSPAWLKDYSSNGFAMVCPHCPDVGNRLLLYLTQSDGTDVSVPAQVLWRSQSMSGYAVGCCLLDPDDVRHLARAAKQAEKAQRARQPAAERPSPWLFAGMTAIAFFGPPVVYTTIRTLSQSNVPVAAHAKSVESVGPTDSRPVTIPLAADIEEPLAEIPGTELTAIDASRRVGRLREPDASTDVSTIGQPAGIDPPMETSRAMTPPSRAVATDRTEFAPTNKTGLLPVQNARNNAVRHPEITRQPQAISPVVVRAVPPVLVPSREEGQREPEPIAPPVPPRIDTNRRSPVPAEPVPRGNLPSTLLATLPERAATRTEPTEDEVRRAAAFYQRGLNFYRRGQLPQAARALRAAGEHERANPLYVYVLAIFQYKLNQVEDARQNVYKAARLEQDRPISNWGQAMQRYQGQARVWLERTRAKERARRGG